MHPRHAVFALALAVFPALADETADRIRASVAAAQPSVHLLRCVVEVEFQGQTQELKIEVPVLSLDAGGLLVAPNPEQFLGQLAQRANLQTKGFQLVLPDGKEQDAKSVGRDSDTGLLFLRLEEKGAAPKPMAVHASALQMGDVVFSLRRVSSSHPEMICQDVRVTAVLQKPRLMYMISAGMGPGTPILAEDGKLVGLFLAVRDTDAEGRANQLGVVLPMAQIADIAKGIHEEEGEEASPEPPAEHPGN